MPRSVVLVAGLVLMAGGVALAQMQTPSMPAMPGGHGARHGGAAGSEPASTQAFRAANAKMHRDMDIRYSGNADRDFIAGMIAHHQGAIDMARVVLAYGSDPEVKRLANEIIAAQEKEISWMREWLARQPAR
jgi:uncharacterized protein (DUF305 family)